jgi:hypothetical protein
MQPAVAKLVALGRLPRTDDASEEVLKAFGDQIEAITKPVTCDEARALSGVFGDSEEDDAFGLAWMLVHIIETCGVNVADIPGVASNPWVQYLDERWQRGQGLP